ncbi:substrate-binding periplasmic protein [Marinobacter sp.]|uniref:substrate-binding periplasmic protein n=1 Tax=Marinobacter sp. TaxID=50741 RepID=UPI003BA87FE9
MQRAVSVAIHYGVVAVLLGSFGATSHAASPTSTVKICYESWPPYIFRDDEGEMRGIAVELMNTALSDLELDATYEELPFKRCVSEVQSGASDVAMPVTEGRSYLLHSRTVFAHWTLAAIVSESLSIEEPVTLEKLNDLSVLIISGYVYPENITRWAENHPDITDITYSADGEGMVPFRMLEFGRADVFIEDNFWSANLIQNNDLSLRVLEPVLGSAVSVAGYRKELTGLRDDIDRILETRGQSFRDELFTKYTGYAESFFSGL